MDRTKGVIMAKDDKKEDVTLTSTPAEEVHEDLKNPPAVEDIGKVEGDEDGELAAPKEHPADPDFDHEEVEADKAKRPTIERVSADDVYGQFNNPENTDDQLDGIRLRESKRPKPQSKSDHAGIIDNNIVWTLVGIFLLVAIVVWLLGAR